MKTGEKVLLGCGIGCGVFLLLGIAGFLLVGYVYRGHALGVLSMAWGALAMSAGAFDICFISAVLGGPLSGAKIRSKYK